MGMLLRLLSSHSVSRFVEGMHAEIIQLQEAFKNLPQIANLLHNGGIVALPTDTVYGIACSANNSAALEKMWRLKGRSLSKPMAICLHKVDVIPHWCDTSHLPDGVLKALLPGPVTVLLPRRVDKDPLSPLLNPGASLVGVRVPDHGFVQSLITALSQSNVTDAAVGHPVVLTSANLSGDISSLTIQEFSSVWPSLDLIVDGGPLVDASIDLGSAGSARSGSTIVDLSKAHTKLYHIVRRGSALKETIETLEQGYGLRNIDPDSC